jgi:hypothetical protein
MATCFIIPQSGQSIIAQLINGEIHEIRKIDIPFQSKSVITENNIIVSICFELKSLKIFNVEGVLLKEINNVSYKAIACKKNTVYFGGEFTDDDTDYHVKGEMFSVIDFNNLDFQLSEITLPIHVVMGKSIDDILINENRLILLDNVVYPKYILEYDITNPSEPVHIKTKHLPNNGTYEHIIKGDINNEWMIIFSSTAGRGGVSQHITISGKKEEILSIDKPWHTINKRIPGYTFEDICLKDHFLFILRSDALGFIDLNKTISKRNFKKLKIALTQFHSIIKSPCNTLILINENSYEKIESPVKDVN